MSVSHATEQHGLQVLTSGPLPPNPADLLGSQRFRAVLKRLTEEFEIVILDGPPIQAFAEAAILGSVLNRVPGHALGEYYYQYHGGYSEHDGSVTTQPSPPKGSVG